VKLAAKPWQLVVLGLLVVLGGYLFYSNVIADSDSSASHQPGAVAAHTAAVNSIVGATPAARGAAVRATTRSRSSEGPFHPSMKRKPEDAIDPMQIDPTLRTDLLAKVQAVDLESASRNPFQFGTAPPPPLTPEAKLAMDKIKEAMKNPPPKPAPVTPAGPAGPPPLNLAWKYYGYTSVRGNTQKKAFLLDGEEIMTAAEGEVLQKKFRVVRIGVNSVVMEDTTTKSQQTLPLQEEPATPVSG